MNKVIQKVFGINHVENVDMDISVEGCAVCDAVTSWFYSTAIFGLWAQWDKDSIEVFFKDKLLFQKVKSAV